MTLLTADICEECHRDSVASGSKGHSSKFGAAGATKLEEPLRFCRSCYYRLLTIEFGSILDWMSGGQQEGGSYLDDEGRE